MSFIIHLNPFSQVNAFDEITVSKIDIKDIAKNLSLQCRFNGACGKFYSVAEHSVILSVMF